MRSAKWLKQVTALGLLMVSLSSVAATQGVSASTLHPHTTTQTYNVPLVGSPQNYIWPFIDGNDNSVYNVQDLQMPMYRPLYWFGLGSSNLLQPALSLASVPVASNGNTVYTLTLKTGLKWSNGENVTTKDVAFWVNLERAEAGNYAGYTPTYFPDDVANVTYSGQNITFTMKTATNPVWFLDNAVGVITPMPMAWDITHAGADPGSGGCADATFTSIPAWDAVDSHDGGASACKNVYNYLSSIASDVSNSTWAVYDGPYKLGAYNSAAGTARLVPNPDYTGPQKASVNVQFHNYADETSEITALEAGELNVGGVTPDFFTPAVGLKPGTLKDSTLASKFNLQPSYDWGYSNIQVSFANNASHALTNQLYVRQALQMSIDQASIIKTVYNGYGVGGCTALPNVGDPYYPKTCPYPFSTKNAIALLKMHGWSVPTNKAGTLATGTAICATASKCGVAKGSKLEITWEYGDYSTTTHLQDLDEISGWANAGFKIDAVAKTGPSAFNDVIGDCTSGADTAPALCQWGGWQYGVSVTGEQLLAPGGGGNYGNYNNANVAKLINDTVTSSSAASIAAYATAVAQDLPYIFQPTTWGVRLLSKGVKGAEPPNALGSFNPEYIKSVN
jgi:peptide/nickel transport system substrate-binding protein